MYIDLIIVVAVLVIVLVVFKRFSSFVYAIALIDMFLRIVNYIASNLPITVVGTDIEKFFPSSVELIITKYTNGILCNVLMWVFVGLYACFWFYALTYFLNKRK